MVKYITYPVDLCNGLVKISIPLYEIVDGDIIIPITLNYHASGIKPNFRSNHWIGDGWYIHTGPSLSRIINGGVDELFYFYHMIANSQPTYEQLLTVADQKNDIELDEFYYSLLNTQGRLYFKRLSNTQLKPVTIPVDSIQVNLPVANRYDNFINITDTKGLQYFFGGTEKKFKDYVRSNYGVVTGEYPSSWKINRIYSPLTNRSVCFDYYSNSTEVVSYHTPDAVVMLDKVNCQCTYTFPAISVSQGGSTRYYKYNLTGQQLEETSTYNMSLPSGYQFPMISHQSVSQNNSYIHKISFSGGYVVFTKDEGGKRGLTSIRVYDSSDLFVKQIDFIQTTSGYPEVLTLKGLKITSSMSGEVEKYTFNYMWGIMEEDDTRSIDKWGYYNGADNATLVPPITTQAVFHNYPSLSPTVTISLPGGNREPNEAAMQKGVLTGIVYPTGGSSTFIYEAHRYRDSNGNTKLAGGLRIKQILEYDGESRSRYRNFKYSTTSASINGAGILNVIPQSGIYPPDSNFLYYSEVKWHQYVGLSLSSTFLERRWSDHSMVNLFSEQGSSVSYPFVVETVSSDYYGTQITGERRHSFDVSSSYPLKLGNTDIVAVSRDEWSKGSLMSETFSKTSTNATLEPVYQRNFSHNLQYGFGNDDNKIRQWYVFKSHRFCGIEEMLVPDQYKNINYIWKDMSNGRLSLSTQHDYSYTDSGTIEQISNYGYDTYGNVIQTTKTIDISSGEKEIITTAYAKDMVNQGRDPSGVYKAMVNSNIVGVPIEVKEYKNNISTNNLLTTVTTNYSKFNNKFFAPSEIIYKIRDNVQERKILFNYYDNYGNVLEQQNIDGTKEVYLWGYSGQYPVAKISGSDFLAVKQRVDTTFLYNGNDAQISYQLTNLRNGYTNYPGVHVSTYTYRPLTGMTSETDPRGSTTYYLYDGFGRLKRIFIKEKNVESTIQTFEYHYKP